MKEHIEMTIQECTEGIVRLQNLITSLRALDGGTLVRERLAQQSASAIISGSAPARRPEGKANSRHSKFEREAEHIKNHLSDLNSALERALKARDDYRARGQEKLAVVTQKTIDRLMAKIEEREV